MTAPRVLALGTPTGAAGGGPTGAGSGLGAAAVAALGATLDTPSLATLASAGLLDQDHTPAAVCIGALPDAETARAVGGLLAALGPAVPRIVEAALTDADGVDRVDAETLAEIKRSVLLGTTLLVASLEDGRRLAGLPPGDRDVDASHVALLLLTIGVDAVLLEGICDKARCTDLAVGDALADGELMIDCASAPIPGRRAVLAAGTAAGLAAGRDLTDAIRAAEAFARDTLTAPA